ncbi:MAG: YggT family protein [Chlamydiae bacterium]|nr:YggT family protein [Chlamydiota bacterium]
MTIVYPLHLVVHWIFQTYTVMLFARIGLSWFPNLRSYRFADFLIFFTEPYLAIFRKIIPPLGGMVDFSPMLGFFALQFIEKFCQRCISVLFHWVN